MVVLGYRLNSGPLFGGVGVSGAGGGGGVHT